MKVKLTIGAVIWVLTAFAFSQFESFGTSQKASISKHVTAIRMKRPIVALTGAPGGARNFNEAVVEGKIVAYGVLPALLILFEVWKFVHDVSVDLVQGHHAGRRTLDRHGDECDVRVRGLHVCKLSRLLAQGGGPGIHFALVVCRVVC